MDQVIQLVGALLILCAFILTQRGSLNPRSRTSLLLNLGGSAILAVLALLQQNWGFVLLEVVWAIVSVQGLLASASRRAERV
jgi:hypothetical protein